MGAVVGGDAVPYDSDEEEGCAFEELHHVGAAEAAAVVSKSAAGPDEALEVPFLAGGAACSVGVGEVKRPEDNVVEFALGSYQSHLAKCSFQDGDRLGQGARGG